ncbi:MAG: hypothetical protein ABIJ97_17430 [Bacteroidota bacterium]
MKIKKQYILLCFSLVLFMSAKNSENISDHLVYKDKFIDISVEKVIYQSPASQNFILKFIIKNNHDKTIGIDLSDYWKVIYPNQWGIYNKPRREVIDEERIIPDTVINKELLLKRFKSNSLSFIKPGETLEYYRDWNGSGEKIVLDNKDEYLIISVDGQMFLTDGSDCDHIAFSPNINEAYSDVVFSYPLTFRTVPKNALIINKN